jgi:Tfp pilus assembly protein PilF
MRLQPNMPTMLAIMPFVAIGCVVLLTGCAKVFPRPKLDYRTIDANPNQDVARAKKLNEQAIAACDKGKCEEAERLLQEALIADVTFGPAHNNLGRMYYQHGQYYLAAWEFEYAMRLMPNQAEPLNNLALLYETVGKLDEAVANYETAHTMRPDHGEYLANLARCRWRRGDRDAEAVELLRELTFRDSRPQWRSWAQEQLVLFEAKFPQMPFVTAPNLETVPGVPAPTTLPEVLPIPQADAPSLTK